MTDMQHLVARLPGGAVNKYLHSQQKARDKAESLLKEAEQQGRDGSELHGEPLRFHQLLKESRAHWGGDWPSKPTQFIEAYERGRSEVDPSGLRDG